MKNLPEIFEKLSLTEENGLCISSGYSSNKLPDRIQRLIKEIIKPSAFFCMDSKPFILFFEDLKDKDKKFKEIWNFNSCPIVIISNNNSIEIYNGLNYLSEKKSLQPFGNEEQLTDFSYFNLVTGKTWDTYKNFFNDSNKLDYKLLSNIKAARTKIMKQIPGPNSLELANSLIGKIIFIRYLIDRKVKLNYKNNFSDWTNEDLCTILKNPSEIIDFFRYLKSQFNGDLFTLDESMLKTISHKCYEVLIRLINGDEIETGQYSLFNIYDFSIIPVEFISNMYESFIGQKEQKLTGAYYTPLFLVDYILAETIGKRFSENDKEYSCKILDPACGSGIFLVESLRKIIDKYQQINPDYNTDVTKYKKQLEQIVLDNIFGLDKDKRAIDVAIFSIYLTLLDYQEPSDIESFKLPSLLDKNFFVADFFVTQLPYNDIFREIKFDFVLGNPPWGVKDKNNETHVSYIKNLSNNLRKIKQLENPNLPEISNEEIAQAFVIRSQDFCTSKTECALILTSKILYNIKGKAFRKYLLENYIVKRIFELCSVRKDIFKGTNAPSSILFYKIAQPNSDTNSNIVQHISLKPTKLFLMFNVFTIQGRDYKEVAQQRLKEFDYLWKILVYGNYLDFNLIYRLKQEYPTIQSEIKKKGNTYKNGKGLTVKGEGKIYDAASLKGKPFIDTSKKGAMDHFYVNLDTSEWNIPKVQRIRDTSLYQAPMLLFKKGFNVQNFRLYATMCYKDAVFTGSITAVKNDDKNKLNRLKIMAGIINSSLAAYLNILTFSSSGVEREQAHNPETFSLPFISEMQIKKEKISKIVDKLHTESSREDFFSDSTIINDLFSELDKNVLLEFNLSQQEMALIDYTINHTIPYIVNFKNNSSICDITLKEQDEKLTDYIQVFFTKFNEIYEKQNLKLSVEIKYTPQIIGIFFKLVSFENESHITWTRLNDDTFLKLATKLSGHNKITEKLFIQKDIRGFEEDGFYIIRPNESNLWHTAIAYYDLHEFIDAILIAGRRSSGEKLN